MNAASVKYAVQRFEALRAELSELAKATGLPQPRALIRHAHHRLEEAGWACTEIGFDELDGQLVFWGAFQEQKHQHLVVLDPATIDSIEFETYGN